MSLYFVLKWLCWIMFKNTFEVLLVVGDIRSFITANSCI